jgi:hypothetical protein
MLGLIFSFHPQVGPKNPHAAEYVTLQAFLDAVLVDSVFDYVASEMEEKRLWDEFLPVNGVDLRTGAELTLLENPLDDRQRRALTSKLAQRLKEPRFFAKAPFNTFRVHVLRDLFPDAKILAIHRDGRDVVASWGRKQNRWEKFGGYAEAIPMLARKWNEAVGHIEQYRQELNIKTVLYEDLVINPRPVLEELFDFCELEVVPELFDGLNLRTDLGLWRERVPQEHHAKLNELTADYRRRIGFPDADD